jgi:hypothetical protein
MEKAARALGVQLQLLEVRGANDFDGAFGAMRKERAGAFTLLPIPLFLTPPDRGLRDEQPIASDLPLEGICGGRGSHVLRCRCD